MDEKYFAELSRILSKHGIESGPVENGRLVIRMDGQPVVLLVIAIAKGLWYAV